MLKLIRFHESWLKKKANKTGMKLSTELLCANDGECSKLKRKYQKNSQEMQETPAKQVKKAA